MVYGTVKAHQGQLEIQSQPGRGTCVRVLFPAAPVPADAPTAGTPPPPRPEPGHRALKVLLVDDDELIQSSTQEVLEILGHTVRVNSSGEQALQEIEGGLSIDVVILDLNMPGLGGAGTLPRLRSLLPAVPVLLATGRADQFAQDLVQAHPRVTLLPKPFTIDELERNLLLAGRICQPSQG
jgi:CheY-like chemotaxis protein